MSEIEPIVLFRVTPVSPDDERMLAAGVSRLTEVDRSVRVRLDMQTGETIVLGMGEAHLQAVRSRLETEFGVRSAFGPAQAAYRETIRRTKVEQATFIRQLKDRREYGHCILKFEPLGRGAGFEMAAMGTSEKASPRDLEAIREGVTKGLAAGALIGAPVIDVKVTIQEASFNDPDTDEMSLEKAAMMAARAACKKADPTILEPIVRFKLTTSTALREVVMTDLMKRRAALGASDQDGNSLTLQGTIPASEALGYGKALLSISDGEAAIDLAPSHFAEVPSNVLEALTGPPGSDESR